MTLSPETRVRSASRTPRGSTHGSRARARSPRSPGTEMRAVLIEPMEEARFAATMLHEAGASTTHARLVGSALAAADVRGKYKFGLLTLPSILSALGRGTLDARASPQLVNDAPTLAWVDGGEAFGPVIGHYCMNLALHKARTHGIGVVFCHSRTDLGFPGWYTSMAQKKNLVGLCFSSFHEKQINSNDAAAGETNLGLNRLSASAPCLDANNFELQISWRLALPPQTMKPRMPAELRRATSSEIVLNEDARPPPGACGHDPRKGFLAALVVEGLCGFLGGIHYKGQPKGESDIRPFYLSFPLMSVSPESKDYGSAKPEDPEDGGSLQSKLSPGISEQPSNGETVSEQPSDVNTPDDSKESPSPGTDSSEPVPRESTITAKSTVREIDCSAPPPPDVKAVDDCSCAEDAPKKTTPPGEQAVVCVPPEKAPVTQKPSNGSTKHVSLDEADDTTPEERQSSETDEFGVPYRQSDQGLPSSIYKPDENKETPVPLINVTNGKAAYSPNFSSDESPPDEDYFEGAEAAHCFIVIDPEAVEPGFSTRLGSFLRNMTSQEPLDPARPVLVPGDPERMCILRAQRQGGVRFLADDVKRINLLAERMGVDPVEFSPDVEYAWWRSDV